MTPPRPCPACGRLVATTRGYVNGLRVLQCRPCGTLHTGEIGATDFAEVYEGYYTEENLVAPEFVAHSLDRILSSFEPYRQSNRMLDVGFGGAFAMLGAERAGWDIEGVEISEPAVKNALELGLRAVQGELGDVGYPSGHFDVVICSEVFEHVPNPRRLAEEIARVLRPGGLMWATTPHGSGISSRLLKLQWSVMCPPEHLQLFSRKGFMHLLRSSGFSLQRVVTENLNPFEIVHDVKARLQGRVRPVDDFDRVSSNYEILETVYSRRSLTVAKEAVHAVLRTIRLGDSLKVWATRNAEPASAPALS